MRPAADSTRLNLKVVPGASRTEIVGWLGGTLKVRVAAAPERGKANAAVEAIVAEALGVSVRAVTIVAGRSSAQKTITISGMTSEEVEERLGRRDD